MENTSSNRGGAKPGIRFGFSWADEVEREEREQQQQEEEEEQRRWETEREQIKADPFGAARPREVEQQRWETERERHTKADPFGAARPREVVLAEKGVDWRARDRELDLHLRTAPRPRPRRSRNHAAATATTSKGPVAAHGVTPARDRDRDAAGAGRTPHPRGRRAAASTPPLPLPPPTVSRSAWGGSKRKCAGEVPGAPSRRVRQVDDQMRKVFGERNVGDGCASSIRASDNGSQAQGIKSSMPAAVADGENRCSSVPATKVTATEAGESAVAQKRKGGKRRNARRSKKTANQQTLVC